MTHNSSRAAWGVDGCKAGWFWFRLPIWPAGEIAWGVVKKLRSLFDEDKVGEHDLILVDIPIGLPTESTKESDFRKCDDEARKRLGARMSSVFSVPRREVVDDLLSKLKIGQTDGEKAWKWKRARRVLDQREPPVEKGEGRMTAQSFAILPKIIEVDDLLRRSERAKQIVRETHPEVCFWALNGQEPMEFAKKHGLGFEDRVRLLDEHHHGAKNAIFEACKGHRGVGSDDIVDAMACAVTASLVLENPQMLPVTIRNTIRDPFDPLDSEPMIVYAERNS